VLIQVTLEITSVEQLTKVFGALKPFLVDTGGLDNGAAPEETNLCPIHQVPLRQFSKNGRSWRAHALDNGKWCSGK
jgi:hypothetical protein